MPDQPSPEAAPAVDHKRMGSPLDLEQTRELFSFLTGASVPKGFVLKQRPKLTPRKAFTVIYVLQEAFGLIPDHFEQCDNCLSLFDDWSEGHYSEKAGKHYCDGCLHLAPADDEEENNAPVGAAAAPDEAAGSVSDR